MNLLALEIAGVRVDLVVAGADPAGLERYLPFAGAAGRAGWTLELLPLPAGLPPGPGRRVLEREGTWVVEGAEGAGALDPAACAGTIRRDPGLLLLDTFLRCVVGVDVLARGGLLLHGATVVVDGAAHVFPARSGSGKSTLAGRAGHPLSDELSVLLPAGGRFQAHATPWWVSRGGSAPVACVYALAWDGEGAVRLPRSALQQLGTNLVLPLDTPASRSRGLAAAAALARTVPHARLAFRPDSDVDQLLRAFAASHG